MYHASLVGSVCIVQYGTSIPQQAPLNAVTELGTVQYYVHKVHWTENVWELPACGSLFYDVCSGQRWFKWPATLIYAEKVYHLHVPYLKRTL